jgi:hypothetical protein
MEEQDEMFDTMRLDQELALATQLASAEEVRAARREAATSARNIEPIVMPNAQRTVEKRVGRFLEAAVRTGSDEHARPLGVPRHSECE